jgi:microcystin-dependent protein
MAKLQIEKQKNNDINITLGGGVLRLSNEPLATYPVGTIIETTSEVSPAQLYGGTWEEFGKGKVLVGRDTSDSDFNTILKTGGEKKHTLSVEEMPSHSHDTGLSYMVSDGSKNQAVWWSGVAGYKTNNTGGSQPHNNLQPYIVVYRWRRIA